MISLPTIRRQRLCRIAPCGEHPAAAASSSSLSLSKWRLFYRRAICCLELLWILELGSWCFPLLAAAPKKDPIISTGSDGKLIYASDSQGNRIPDFSHCGYAGGDRPIPDAPIRVVVPSAQRDSTARIQRAINYVANLPLDTNGLRGAVLLLRGRHEISGSLRLHASGIVLRGQGMDENGTVLVATGEDRRTLIRIIGLALPKGEGRGEGEGAAQSPAVPDTLQIMDDYIPVGATAFHLKLPFTLKPDDTINIIRPSTQVWIDRLGMTDFGGGIGDWRLVWKPGSRHLIWDRVVKSVKGDLITVDAPITTAIEKSLGGGRIEPYLWRGRVENVGVENLRCESTFDPANPKDENHSWFAVTIENAQNAWVRQITAIHFAGSMVAIYENSKQITVQDCLSLAPVSEEAGYRRHTFFTMGQLCLFLHCHAEHGRHDFSVGHCAGGPNAFVQCDATLPLADSGPIESWASGVLYDNVTIDGNGLSLANRGPNPHGAGWAAANSVLWQCSASFIRCANPPTARNWAFGCWGEFEGDGTWRSSNESVKPDSLYLAQLTDRLGRDAVSRVKLLRRSTEESTNPTLEQAAQLIAASRQPARQLAAYIASASTRNPITSDPGNAKTIDQLENSEGPSPSPPPEERAGERRSLSLAPRLSPLALSNGWLICNGRLLIGARTNVAWWRGNLRPAQAPLAGPGITRFVPGRSGPGFTDDLTELADILSTNGIAALDHHYGLWYDRRRDDHERVRRTTGDAWPPFYEQPFARSGLGASWDGLSRYDTGKYNPWYWSRLKQFADLCDERGLVLFHENYFQHNILEAGAHWADFPWRSANNINNTGFPEPPPYAGDKRIFMAEQFYDVSHPVRRSLHRAYIRKCLNNFATNSNVIQFTGAEFTGPLSFVEFWLDTIIEWEHETGHNPLIALSCTKDVQDSIISDPTRKDAVDIIDFRYWWQTERGLFAPKGGQNLAPRQFERQWKGGRPTDLDLARMTAEYRQRYPTKPVICDFPQGSWAYLCAGGSMPNLPRTTDARLLAAIPQMRPWSEACNEKQWVLREPGHQYLIYRTSASSLRLHSSQEKSPLILRTIDPKTGAVTEEETRFSWAQLAELAPERSPSIYWLVHETDK
jgi:Family of unknown function (DUF6298)